MTMVVDDTSFADRKERLETGRERERMVPLEAHAEWQPPAHRRDPVDVLEESNRGRLPELTPIRYGRMLASPFTFLRGSAAIMASDLASQPSSGIECQLCGDCHILNFGIFATPERNLVFDINDFDETHPGPFEWDLKRLAASIVVAGRAQRLDDESCRAAATECARSYRERIREYSRMSPVEVWYARLDVDTLVEMAPTPEIKKRRKQMAKKARERVIENMYPRIVREENGRGRFVDQPPLFFHAAGVGDSGERLAEAYGRYRATLSPERSALLARYRLEDVAMKVVGIGSVGTRCAVVLLRSPEGHPLVLQVKEARPSVLEPFTTPSQFTHHGERVVVGQKLMQASSDIFLGWTSAAAGFDAYVRQLRDMKFTVPVLGDSDALIRYADVCGWALARAHAKAGDPAQISGYVGKDDRLDEAIGAFAIAYADQTEADYAPLVEAEASGRIEALREDEL